MNGRIAALLATTALVAVGCSDSSSSVDSSPVAGPLGLVFDTAVSVRSADTDGDTVRVTDDLASMTLNALTFDGEGEIETISLTFGLPDGTSVTMDNVFEGSLFAIGPWWGVGYENEEGTVELIVGAGLDDPGGGEELFDTAPFMVARIDPGADDPDLWFDTYMVTGNETESMPFEGSAVFSGISFGSVYLYGEIFSDFYGSAWIGADFESGTVDLLLEGDGEFVDYYELWGNDLTITGSGYEGNIVGIAILEGECECNMTGDVLGAFYGETAEATAGVFGASESDLDGEFVDIVGGFAAYDEAQAPGL